MTRAGTSTAEIYPRVAVVVLPDEAKGGLFDAADRLAPGRGTDARLAIRVPMEAGVALFPSPVAPLGSRSSGCLRLQTGGAMGFAKLRLPSPSTDEREVLLGFIRWQREQVVATTEGLSEEQLPMDT